MITTVTDKGQVTLPKPIRDRLGIQPGAKIDFELRPDNTLVGRVLTRGSTGLFGLLKRHGEAVRSLEEMDAGVTAAVRSRSRIKR
ncbi:MAG: AbrB/MazE/SpoVT family DNA-binding domain-containing protein [Variovorax sp.]